MIQVNPLFTPGRVFKPWPGKWFYYLSLSYWTCELFGLPFRNMGKELQDAQRQLHDQKAHPSMSDDSWTHHPWSSISDLLATLQFRVSPFPSKGYCLCKPWEGPGTFQGFWVFFTSNLKKPLFWAECFSSEETQFLSTPGSVFIPGRRILFGDRRQQKSNLEGMRRSKWHVECARSNVWDWGGCAHRSLNWNLSWMIDETLSLVTWASNLKYLVNEIFWLSQKYSVQTSLSWEDRILVKCWIWSSKQSMCIYVIIRRQSKVQGERAGLEIGIANILNPAAISNFSLIQIIDQLRHLSALHDR